MNFKEQPLSNILEINPRMVLKKGTITKKIAMEHLNENIKRIKGYELAEFKSGSKFKNQDTLVARITPCLENGKTAFVNILEENEVAFGSTEFFVVRAKEGKGDPQFIYYLMRHPEVREAAIKSMTGTSGRQRAQKEAILDYSMSLPNIIEQKKIGYILSLFDSKIEENNDIIRNLEQFSQTLFKHWFIDFEFPNEEGQPYKSSGGEMVESELGEIPKEWQCLKLGEINCVISDHVANGSFKSLKNNVVFTELPNERYALFARNTDLKKNLMGELKYITKESYDFLKKSQLFGGEIIISNVGDVGTIHRCPTLNVPMVLGNNQIYIHSEKEFYNEYFYLLLKSNMGKNLINSITSGSVQMKFNKTDFRNSKIVLPSDYVLKSSFSQLKNVLDLIEILNSEIKKLQKLRNTLVPKLLSGEIEIPDEFEV